MTHDPRDRGVFKTPTLREIEHTAPYMHDGSLKTLDEVVEFYNKGGIPNKNLDRNEYSALCTCISESAQRGRLATTQTTGNSFPQ